MTVKLVMRYDPDAEETSAVPYPIWQHGTPGLPGGGYSAKLSVSIVPRIFGWEHGWHEWRLTLAGAQIHHLKAFGGIIE